MTEELGLKPTSEENSTGSGKGNSRRKFLRGAFKYALSAGIGGSVVSVGPKINKEQSNDEALVAARKYITVLERHINELEVRYLPTCVAYAENPNDPRELAYLIAFRGPTAEDYFGNDKLQNIANLARDNYPDLSNWKIVVYDVPREPFKTPDEGEKLPYIPITSEIKKA